MSSTQPSKIWPLEPGQGRIPRLDPRHHPHVSRATVADPDGNSWRLPEITERRPGQV
jgi:hypothetical protein